jgi:CheY-like chemotaxis protein
MPSNTKVLVVDDNPMMRGLLERALAPVASVTIASSAGDALRKATQEPPDLIISDFQMPGMDGRQLLEHLKSQATTARVPVVLAASRSDVSERLKPLHDSVEDFLEKPFFANEAVARIKRILHKIALEKMAREGPGETMVRGSLAQMSVIDLLQSLELGRKTCGLALKKNGEQCQMFFTEGQITHAVYGQLKGDEAVYKALAWTERAGTFQIDFSAATKEQTTTRSTQGLLMEGLRLLDEANRDGAGQGA